MYINKIHTTNYFNTFIEVAEDSACSNAQVPVSKKDEKTIAELHYEIVSKNPYKYTSDEVLFKVFEIRNDLLESELEQARLEFFSKGQPCFRTSPLTKRYGFGVHANSEGKIAIYAMESEEYHKFLNDPAISKVKAMRNVKKS